MRLIKIGKKKGIKEEVFQKRKLLLTGVLLCRSSGQP
jgi:hypothetical protein